MDKVLFCTLRLFLGMIWSSCRAACRVGQLQGQIVPEHCLHPAWQKERHSAHRGTEEGLSLSVVVMYCTTICVRGKSITILQHMEEIKSFLDHLSYAGHIISRVTLTPDADHSICLSCQVFPLT